MDGDGVAQIGHGDAALERHGVKKLEPEGERFDPNFHQAMFDIGTASGKVYALPFAISLPIVYVNLDLITAAGQPNPRDLIAGGEWTYDKLVEIAAATGASQGVAGLHVPVDDPYAVPLSGITPLGLAWGARPWSEDGTQCEFTSPESVEFFDWFHSQVFDTRAIPGPGPLRQGLPRLARGDRAAPRRRGRQRATSPASAGGGHSVRAGPADDPE
jgi:ABC-type glycerol-3-phosphate transport system substrate-binding protein